MYSLDDVLLKPQRGVLASRSMADTRSMLYQGHWLDLPVLSAPMPAVTDAHVAQTVLAHGGGAILHRFQLPSEQLAQWNKVGSENTWCAVGYDEDRFRYLYSAGVSKFCLDVAHAHSDEAVRTLRRMYQVSRKIKVIAGTVATPEGALWLADSGVDGVTVGIGCGSACTTREVTGFGYPQLAAIQEVVEAVGYGSGMYGLGVIANGGIKSSGDLVKALAAGANGVIIGRLLAQASDAPYPGNYWGNASHRVNGHKSPEGADLAFTPGTQTVAEVLKQLEWGLKSGISYGGGTNIEELRANAEFVPVAYGVHNESMVRV